MSSPERKIRVLSLFDGISCLRVALGDLNVEYFASEIDKRAITISKKNYPDIKHIGNVLEVSGFCDIDLLVGGSPCQDLSIAKRNRRGLLGSKSKLFFEYVRIKKETNPKFFILENVASMSKSDRNIITKELGVEPMLINSSFFSAQSRKRLFWTNIKINELPTKSNLSISNILLDIKDIPKNELKMRFDDYYKKENKKESDILQLGAFDTNFVIGSQHNRIYDVSKKSPTSGLGYYLTKDGIRTLSCVEVERLQSLPDNYTQGISKTARLKCLNNGFNVDVMKFILAEFIKEERK